MNMSAAATLFVLRHAHSAPAAPDQDDYDRGLDARGELEAASVRTEMTSAGYRPERIACSGAARTRATLAAQAIEGAAVEFADDLYSGGTGVYLDRVRGFGPARSGMVVGHNPMVAEFVASIAGSGEEAAMRQLAEGVPPGTLAVVAFSLPFADVKAGAGVLKRLIIPRR